MGKASSSSEAQSAIDNAGAGVLNYNQPHYVVYLIVGAVVLIGLYIFLKKGRG